MINFHYSLCHQDYNGDHYNQNGSQPLLPLVLLLRGLVILKLRWYNWNHLCYGCIGFGRRFGFCRVFWQLYSEYLISSFQNSIIFRLNLYLWLRKFRVLLWKFQDQWTIFRLWVQQTSINLNGLAPHIPFALLDYF